MPAARVSPASIERNHLPHYSSQRRQDHRQPSTRSSILTSRSCKLENRKPRSFPVVPRQSWTTNTTSNGKLSHCDSIKSKEKASKRTWVSFAKRYREWTTRYDNFPRVVDFYGQLEPQSSFDYTFSGHRVRTNEFRSIEKLKSNSVESTESNTTTDTGNANDTLVDNELGSRNSLQFIRSSNCAPSTEPNGHLSNIGISKTKENDDDETDPSDHMKTRSSSSCRTVMTPYGRIVKSISQNDHWRRELTLGRRIGFYRIRGDVGSGNFSQVKVATHSLTGEKVAIKILDRSKLDSKTQKMLNREIGSMEKLHHPNLVQLFEVIENFSKIYLVLEFAPGGELYHKISNQGKLNESMAKSLFSQIISAIDHMHRHHIIHRDIKAENVFFSDPDTVKVGDFGFSTEVELKSDLLNTYCGSPPYAAPELFSDECYVGPPVDLWACGVLLYFMVTGQMPFKAATVTTLKKLILDADFIIPDYVSVECSWLIRSLLQRNPRNRLETKDVQEDKWLKGLSFPGSLPRYKYTRDRRSNKLNQKVTLSSPSPSHSSGFQSKDIVYSEAEEVTDLKDLTIVESMEVKDIGNISKDEKEAIEYLNKLGISEEMLIANQAKGVRSSITGIFRITMHRIISGKHFKSPATSEHCMEKGNQNPPPIPLKSINNRSFEREIDTIQNNGPNVPSESSSSSRGGGEKELEKFPDEKVAVVKMKKGNNVTRMPQIFTDSEGYITLPSDTSQVKTNEINTGYKINCNGEVSGTKEYNNQDPLKHWSNRSSGIKTVAFDINDTIYHDLQRTKKKKKSWKERLVYCCVS